MSPAPRRRQCGAMQEYELLLETHSAFRRNQQRAEEFTARAIDSGEAERVSRKLITIPTVVHVVYKRERENISDAQVKSQITVLNRDYRAKNPDRSKVPPPWKGLVGDANIAFELAKRDPNGKPTNGITRTKTTKNAFGTGNAVKTKGGGGTPPWPTTRYLNIWVCNLGGGLLGYAQFPGGPAATDGVVILYSAFGTQGAAQAPFNRGRTTTHEVGHFLNLRHIWGDTLDCSGGDRCADTPNCAGPNYGKPSFPHASCRNGPHGDMFMNYMDYVDDDAMFMFTAGQVTRMNATLAGPRKALARL
jgi:hypothetical protein